VPLSHSEIIAFNRQKNDVQIQGIQCFFVIQIYDTSTTDVDVLQDDLSLLGLRMTWFPFSKWKSIPFPHFQNLGHLPFNTSNYALMGEKLLDKKTLIGLKNMIYQRRMVFLFGFQAETWFNTTRVLSVEESDTLFFQPLVETLAHNSNQPSFIPNTVLVFQDLLSTLDHLSAQLK
jgi:hypothetical protein